MILTTWSQFRASFMVGASIGPDGVQIWDPTVVDQPGFIDTIVFPDPSVTIAFPYLIQVDATNDTVPGTDRYHWYLSQRTDDPTKQYWEVQRNDTSFPTVTNSGKIKLVRTALSTTLYPTVNNTTTAAMIELFTDLDLYCYRIDDRVVQHKLLLDVLFR